MLQLHARTCERASTDRQHSTEHNTGAQRFTRAHAPHEGGVARTEGPCRQAPAVRPARRAA
eukprot:8461174-Alexandrium_andersonii.AAC.1